VIYLGRVFIFGLIFVSVQEEVYAFIQGSRNVTDYFIGLKTLREERDNFLPMTACECFANFYHAQGFIIRFLKSLDDHFAVVRSQVLFMDPLRVNLVLSMVTQHE